MMICDVMAVDGDRQDEEVEEWCGGNNYLCTHLCFFVLKHMFLFILCSFLFFSSLVFLRRIIGISHLG